MLFCHVRIYFATITLKIIVFVAHKNEAKKRKYFLYYHMYTQEKSRTTQLFFVQLPLKQKGLFSHLKDFFLLFNILVSTFVFYVLSLIVLFSIIRTKYQFVELNVLLLRNAESYIMIRSMDPVTKINQHDLHLNHLK